MAITITLPISVPARRPATDFVRGAMTMRVAIVHYWMVSMRGGERVLEALCELYPHADIFTHVYAADRMSPIIRRHRVQTSFIGRLPCASRFYKSYLPLMPLALEQLDLREYNLVISSESGPAKGVLTRPDAVHVCYCHTPMRYAWNMYQDYMAGQRGPMRWAQAVMLHKLRQWDVTTAARVDHFVANSYNVAERIRKYYRRDAVVIPPPVNMDLFRSAANDSASDAYVCIGQLIPYKRVDIAVEAFNRLGKKLIVIGEGSQFAALARVASPNITFIGRVDDQALRGYYASCRALIFPGEEDFGIVPLEAMATGRPVLAFGRGGATETVVPGLSGLLFMEQTPESLMDAVLRFEASATMFDPARIVAHAAGFSKVRFKEKFKGFIDRITTEYSNSVALEYAGGGRMTQPMLGPGAPR